ncbi:hypothetical protein GT354_09335 [Streptomyces sp. SID3343]|nr:hypothetical protein [Streptomyces sp. SID3343]
MTTETARVVVEARLRREPDGVWHGRVWTDDTTVDLALTLGQAVTRMLWIGDCASSFTVDRVLDRNAHVTGAGHAPF